MKEGIKFWADKLVIPATLAIIGFFINLNVQNRIQSLDKIKFSDALINETFDTTDIAKSLARIEMLPYLISDKKFITDLTFSVKNYFLEIARQAAIKGNDSLYRSISDIARCFTGNARFLTDTLRNDPITHGAEKALAFVDRGIGSLHRRNLKEAQLDFDSASIAHPAFHSNKVISKTIEQKMVNIKTPEDSDKVSQEVLDTIKSKYPYKINSVHEKNLKVQKL